MTDPNLEKIVNTNIRDIEKGHLGRTIVQASSYLDNIYGFYNRDKRERELSEFIDSLKILSDTLKIKKLNEGEPKNGKRQQQRRKARRN